MKQKEAKARLRLSAKPLNLWKRSLINSSHLRLELLYEYLRAVDVYILNVQGLV